MISVITTAPGRTFVGNLDKRLRGHSACWVADTKLTGQFRNYWRALRVARDLANRYDLDQVTVGEDDIEVCEGTFDYIETYRVPESLAFVTWFDANRPAMVQPFDESGKRYACLTPEPAIKFRCLQLVTYPLRTVDLLLSAPQATWWNHPHEGDTLIAIILDEARQVYGIHMPNLAQHVGAESLANPGKGLTPRRTSANYPGADFDAKTLWVPREVSGG